MNGETITPTANANEYTLTYTSAFSDDNIWFDDNANPAVGVWVITTDVKSGGVTTRRTVPASGNGPTGADTVSMGDGNVQINTSDPLYPSGTVVTFIATCTRASDGAVGTSTLIVTLP